MKVSVENRKWKRAGLEFREYNKMARIVWAVAAHSPVASQAGKLLDFGTIINSQPIL